jgi:hypothetical protein
MHVTLRHPQKSFAGVHVLFVVGAFGQFRGATHKIGRVCHGTAALREPATSAPTIAGKKRRVHTSQNGVSGILFRSETAISACLFEL